METKTNIILELSSEFALQIIEYTEILEGKRKYVIARQLMKSGTSIGGNINEAQNIQKLLPKIVYSTKSNNQHIK